MAEKTGFLGSATVGTKGQIVIPADAREAMQIKEGDKVVILRGPREGSVLVFRVDSFDMLLQKAGIADDERTAMAAEHTPTKRHVRILSEQASCFVPERNRLRAKRGRLPVARPGCEPWPPALSYAATWCNQASTKSLGRRGAGPRTSQWVPGLAAGRYGVAGVLGRAVACLVGVAGVVGPIVDCVVAGGVAGPGLVRVAS